MIIYLMDKNLLALSRTLTYNLRHNLDNFNYDEEGFVNFSELSDFDKRLNISKEQLLDIVNKDNKSRFKIKFVENNIFIRANQGHSVKIIDDDKLLKKIASPIEGCFHGTYKNVIEKIKTEGLSRMTRKHIHISKSIDSKSGSRPNCNTRIFINMEKALNDGYNFYESDNGVILTPGNSDGFLPPEYFKEIVFIKK